MSLKVIFIDWDGTLSRSRFWEHWQIEDPEGYNKIQKVLFAENPGMINDWMRGFVSAEVISAEVAHRTGLNPQIVLTNLEQSCKAMALMQPGVLDVIQKKRENGVKAVIATDNMDTFSRWTVPSLNLERHFDGILTSVARGALKEDVAEDGTSLFFHHYLSQNAIQPSEALWIDDRPVHKIAERLGMQFVQVGSGLDVIQVLQAV